MSDSLKKNDFQETTVLRHCQQGQRPWGHYLVLIEEPTYKVKKVLVKPGSRLSLQLHQRRSEHWYIVQGQAIVTLNQEKILLSVGQSIDIPCRAQHRITNEGTEDLIFIEVQRGEYLGEDDIERFEDDYGRVC